MTGNRPRIAVALAAVLLIAGAGLFGAFHLGSNAWLSGKVGVRAPLPTARGALTAVLLGGEIHVMGGTEIWQGGTPYPVHEIYDPRTGRWRTAAPLPDLNVWGAQATAVGGKIYLIGGWPKGSQLIREYDPRTETWTAKQAMPNLHTYGHAVVAVGREIHVFGGFHSAGQTAVYDTAHDTWRTGGVMGGSYDGIAAVHLDGAIHIFARGTGHQIFDPATGAWQEGPAIPESIHSPAVATCRGRIYIIGGGSDFPGSTGDRGTVLGFDPRTGAWRTVSKVTPRSWPAAVTWGGTIHVLGGFDDDNQSVDAHEVVR